MIGISSNKLKGFSIIEVVIAITIISLMVLIVIPTFVKQNEAIQLDTVSEELINTIQLAQSHAVAAQKEVPITFETNAKKILKLTTNLPAVSIKAERTVIKTIPKFIQAQFNIEIDTIIFQPDKSWLMKKNSESVVQSDLSIQLNISNKSLRIIFYPNSKTIHLLEE